MQNVQPATKILHSLIGYRISFRICYGERITADTIGGSLNLSVSVINSNFISVNSVPTPYDINISVLLISSYKCAIGINRKSLCSIFICIFPSTHIRRLLFIILVTARGHNGIIFVIIVITTSGKRQAEQCHEHRHYDEFQI